MHGKTCPYAAVSGSGVLRSEDARDEPEVVESRACLDDSQSDGTKSRSARPDSELSRRLDDVIATSAAAAATPLELDDTSRAL